MPPDAVASADTSAACLTASTDSSLPAPLFVGEKYDVGGASVGALLTVAIDAATGATRLRFERGVFDATDG